MQTDQTIPQRYPRWKLRIDELLRERSDPDHPSFQETQELIDLVFGSPRETDARIPPEERSAAIEYYVQVSQDHDLH
jgi:hypothetical protein